MENNEQRERDALQFVKEYAEPEMSDADYVPKAVPLVPSKRQPSLAKPPRDYSAKHRRLRLQRLNMFPICEVCQAAFAIIAHHLRYPSETIEDYRAVCFSCHKEIHK
jgi:hypothetical protein